MTFIYLSFSIIMFHKSWQHRVNINDRVIFLPTNTVKSYSKFLKLHKKQCSISLFCQETRLFFYLGLDPSNLTELESGDGKDETLSEVTDAADVLVDVLFDAPDVDDDENDVFCCGCCVV